jgi:hypothetical protein
VKLAQTRSPGAEFFDDPEAIPEARYGAVVLANVLHHVPKPNRRGLMEIVASKLAPGGRLVIFEHNPLNPVTRHAVAICPFDEGVELLYPREVKRLMRGAKLERVAQEYIVFFPHALAFARGMEPALGWLPLGAQTCTVGARRRK